jgi:hypothetical protein
MRLLKDCPQCGSKRLVTGSAHDAIIFVANSARLTALNPGVEVNNWMQACAECGFVATQLSPSDLNEHLARFADARTKAWLNDRPNRPH